MSAVIGIDAAWTTTQPSGVALVEKRDENWQLLASAASYENFISQGHQPLHEHTRATPSLANVNDLVDAASGITTSGKIDMIAVDMPIANVPIISRRVSDNAVSKAYGARKCSTHTPNINRPGPISHAMRDGFSSLGYQLATQNLRVPGLIEVYPHPALVELTGANERLPYKLAKIRKYWRNERPETRRERLIAQWQIIIDALEPEITNVADLLIIPNTNEPTWKLKAFEDALDAVVCAWVGICALEGRAVPYGDADSAIWIPTPKMIVG